MLQIQAGEADISYKILDKVGKVAVRKDPAMFRRIAGIMRELRRIGTELAHTQEILISGYACTEGPQNAPTVPKDKLVEFAKLMHGYQATYHKFEGDQISLESLLEIGIELSPSEFDLLSWLVI